MNMFGNSPFNQGQGTGGASDDMITVGRAIVQNLSLLNATLGTYLGITGAAGSVTLGAAATTVVTQSVTKATSRIVLMPTNAAAADLVNSAASPYITSKTNGTSFTIATADGNAAAGTETFDYILVNPV